MSDYRDFTIKIAGIGVRMMCDYPYAERLCKDFISESEDFDISVSVNREDIEEEKKQYDYIEEGKLMHLVMSGIGSKEDITATLDRLMIEGLISTVEKYNRIKKLVERALAKPDVAEWFDGSYRLYNECTILGDSKKKSRRPDRVMVKGDKAVVVDYKFGREDEEYIKQVKEYMELLRSIGYTDVKGYLWYVYKNYIKEI